ncbi:MAG TPA: NUDIX hydrolase [Acetobacteraceae bacterium]|jgi:ADP-ribose pyrophosphatase YjhB (NUDIX family)|nr:NUDIX hydrolase [Acetobacteraceae bacterium]
MPNDPTWTVTSSRVLLEDRWIRLRTDECVTAAGHRIAPYYVLEYPPWAHVVALTEDDEVVLVRQYRHAVGATLLELPGGMVDPGETPIDAARRELMEEAGYAAETLVPVAALFTNPATHTNCLHTFAARGARRVGTPRLEAGEDGMTVVTMRIDALLPHLTEGLLGHSMQVSALLLALAALGRIDFARPR